MMKRTVLSVVAATSCVAAFAKLPAPDDAAKAKAAETTAKAAWQAKVDAFQLCKAQDRVAAAYRKTSGTTGAAAARQAGASAASASAARAVATLPATGAASAAKAAASSAAPTGGVATPVASVGTSPPPIPACADPGPFAYAPPDQKPLESSGAHSPAANAASPPSVRPESAQMAPAAKGASAKKS